MAVTGTLLCLGTNSGVWSSANNGGSFSSLIGGIGSVGDIKTIGSGIFLIAASNGLYKWNGSAVLSNTGLQNRPAQKIMVLSNKYMVSCAVNGSAYPTLFSSTDGTNWLPVIGSHPVSNILSIDYVSPTAFISSSSGIFRSIDNGLTWVKVGSGIKAHIITDMRSANGKVYAAVSNRIKGSNTGGVFSSADNGVTWQKLLLNDTISIDKIAVDNNSIIAFGYESGISTANPVLYRSTDAGLTWAKLTGYNNVLSTFYHANNSLFITTFGVDGANIDRSIDFGTTWQHVSETGYTGINTTPLAINDAIGSTLYANSTLNVNVGGGVFKSNDNGATWVPINNGLGGSISYVKAVNNNTLFCYVNGFSGYSALLRSTDFGANWVTINSDLYPYTLQDINSGNGSIYISAGLPNFGIDSGYIYESTDNGDTWTNNSLGLPTIILGKTVIHNSKVYVATTGYSVWSKNAGVLPVTFTSISANRTTAGIQVTWKVANELNIRNYEVERSGDGRSFAKIGAVIAAGNSLQQAYNWLDVNPSTTTAYYRVRSVGLSGEVKYTGIVKVETGKSKPGFVVFPNPVESGVINLQFSSQPQGKYAIKLESITGQLIYTGMVVHNGGTSVQIINLPAGIARGTYQVRIISPDKTTSRQTVLVSSN